MADKKYNKIHNNWQRISTIENEPSHEHPFDLTFSIVPEILSSCKHWKVHRTEKAENKHWKIKKYISHSELYRFWFWTICFAIPPTNGETERVIAGKILFFADFSPLDCGWRSKLFFSFANTTMHSNVCNILKKEKIRFGNKKFNGFQSIFCSSYAHGRFDIIICIISHYWKRIIKIELSENILMDRVLL